MRLPLELRREIYKLVLAEMFYPLHCGYEVVDLEDLFVANICNRDRDLRQLLLNRQVGYEVLEIILARDTVLFITTSPRLRTASFGTRNTSQNLSHSTSSENSNLKCIATTVLGIARPL